MKIVTEKFKYLLFSFYFPYSILKSAKPNFYQFYENQKKKN